MGAITFATVLVVYLWRLTQYRAWYFWAMYIGLFRKVACRPCTKERLTQRLVELIGFGARALSARNPTHAGPFVISYIALMCVPIPSSSLLCSVLTPATSVRSGPSFIAAACYATFGRILWWITPRESHNTQTLWCPSRLVTPLFIGFDLGSFFIQLLGAGAVGTAYASKTLTAEDRQSKTKTGLAALKIGFTLQLICFGLFVLIGTRFLYVSRRWAGRPLQYLPPKGANWPRLNWAVNLAAVAIVVRRLAKQVA
jgi:hypothetical protein